MSNQAQTSIQLNLRGVKITYVKSMNSRIFSGGTGNNPRQKAFFFKNAILQSELKKETAAKHWIKDMPACSFIRRAGDYQSPQIPQQVKG